MDELNKVKTFLEQIAKRKAWSDDEDFLPYEYCDANYDDAYWGGVSDGETQMARQILKLIDIQQG